MSNLPIQNGVYRGGIRHCLMAFDLLVDGRERLLKSENGYKTDYKRSVIGR